MIKILIYNKYQKEYYEVIPVKKIEEKIEELDNKEKSIYKLEWLGNNEIFELKIIQENKNILQQLIKENCESEEEKEFVYKMVTTMYGKNRAGGRMKKRFYLEIEYGFYSDEEEEELNEMMDGIVDNCIDYTNVKSVEILPIGRD